MKTPVVFILLLFPYFVFAQTDKSKKNGKKQTVDEFYTDYKFVLDSVNTPYLYYQIFDWIGTKYKYSGKSKKGIDCSGFVCEMYRSTYCVELSGGSRDIFTQVKPVEKKELQEGDMVFFKIKKGQISHVGIYIGNNKFAHASVQSGVIISDLDEEYYKRYFYSGGRIKLDIDN